MAVSQEQINRLRRRTDVSAEEYSDAELAAFLEECAVRDARGHEPGEAAWTPTYDEALAAANVWAEKAAVLAADYDLSADGASLSRSQAYEMARRQVRYWLSRRKGRTVRLYAHREELDAESEELGDARADG